VSVRRALSEMEPGTRGRVVEMGGDGEAVKRLMDMGLIRGTTVEVVRRAPLGDPIEVRLRGFMLTLRRTEAEHITVE
jgi:ferrous iron transport protein A